MQRSVHHGIRRVVSIEVVLDSVFYSGNLSMFYDSENTDTMKRDKANQLHRLLEKYLC